LWSGTDIQEYCAYSDFRKLPAMVDLLPVATDRLYKKLSFELGQHQKIPTVASVPA
jgi:hypothetical protein